MLLISVKNYLKPWSLLQILVLLSQVLMIVFSLFYIYILCMYTDSDGDDDGRWWW